MYPPVFHRTNCWKRNPFRVLSSPVKGRKMLGECARADLAQQINRLGSSYWTALGQHLISFTATHDDRLSVCVGGIEGRGGEARKARGMNFFYFLDFWILFYLIWFFFFARPQNRNADWKGGKMFKTVDARFKWWPLKEGESHSIENWKMCWIWMRKWRGNGGWKEDIRSHFKKKKRKAFK